MPWPAYWTQVLSEPEPLESMKIGIVGTGAVGAATAMALLARARISDLRLVNRNRARAKGVATDLRYGAPLSGPITIADGDYGDLAGAAAVIVTAGINEKAGGATDRSEPAGRLRLLDANADVGRNRGRPGLDRRQRHQRQRVVGGARHGGQAGDGNGGDEWRSKSHVTP